MQRKFVLEVCAFTVASCIKAEQLGANRIELCDNYFVGGVTPSTDTIRAVVEKTTIPIYPIIRPRGGNFFYTDEEFDAMKKSIEICKNYHCAGIATGISLQNGEIDANKLKQLVELAYPMKVTCHRVFDRTPDTFKALEAIIAAGCERILTSGQKNTAIEATTLLNELIIAAGKRIIIMPGSGVRASNILQLAKETSANEFHTSARIPNSSEIDAAELAEILQLLKLT